MTKWMVPLDSARQIGLGSTFTNFLAVVVMALGKGESCSAELFLLAESGRGLPIAPHLSVLWTNGGYSWIQLVK